MQQNNQFDETYDQLKSDIQVGVPNNLEKNIMAKIEKERKSKKIKFNRFIQISSSVAAVLAIIISININTNKVQEITDQDVALVEEALSKISKSFDIEESKPSYTLIYKTNDIVITINN